MAKKGKYKNRWKNRERMYRKQRLYHKNASVNLHSSSEKKKRAQRLKNAGVMGIVERGRGDFKNRKLAVGYVVSEKRSYNKVRIFFSKDHPYYVFDLYKGEIIEEPDEVTEIGDCFYFRNYPDPVYHRRFISNDPENPKRAFEPHCRNLGGGRIREMKNTNTPRRDIENYKEALDEFLDKASKLFETCGEEDETG